MKGLQEVLSICAKYVPFTETVEDAILQAQKYNELTERETLLALREYRGWAYHPDFPLCTDKNTLQRVLNNWQIRQFVR